ncbi:hypothetical protein B0H14DRAFT_3513620 [Mycena olivaceomarginata]|nr:hypothetical protein B0H14DRAFT_3513620 [Mycena olivaceomarginata]
MYARAANSTLISFEVEAYVRNMRVPLLLGEDFQIAYKLGTTRYSSGHCEIRIGQTERVIPASSAKAVDLGFEVRQVHAVRVKGFLWKTAVRRERTRVEKSGKDSLPPVLAAEDTLIQAGSVRNVRVIGPLAGREQWIVEKVIISTDDCSVLAAPTTWVNSADPYIPIANPTSFIGTSFACIPTSSPPLPKAVTNKIMQLQDPISALEGVAYDLRDKLEERDADIRDLDNENLQLWRRINELEQIHGDKLEHIINFIDNNEFTGTGATHTSASGSGSKGKSERDNVFNTAIRKVFMAAMGHGVNVKLEILANDTPIKAGGSYIADSDGTGRLLRPDWSASFNENSRWHKSMLEFARKKAPVFHPTMTESMINAKTDDEILERLENVFKNIGDNYRCAQRNKAKTKGGEDAGENQEEGEHEKRAKELNRRGTRKVHQEKLLGK